MHNDKLPLLEKQLKHHFVKASSVPGLRVLEAFALELLGALPCHLISLKMEIQDQ